MTDRELLHAWFSCPERYKSIDPKRAVWLSEANIDAMSRDEVFMTMFRARHKEKQP